MGQEFCKHWIRRRKIKRQSLRYWQKNKWRIWESVVRNIQQWERIEKSLWVFANSKTKFDKIIKRHCEMTSEAVEAESIVLSIGGLCHWNRFSRGWDTSGMDAFDDRSRRRLEMAIKILRWYTYCWRVEDFYKIFKSGCQCERYRLEAEGMNTLLERSLCTRVKRRRLNYKSLGSWANPFSFTS